MITFAVGVRLKLCSNIDVKILFQRRIWGFELTSNEKGRGYTQATLEVQDKPKEVKNGEILGSRPERTF